MAFEVSADHISDPDVGDKLSWSARLSDGTSLPSWLQFSPASIQFSGVPPTAQVLDIELAATDS